MQISRKMIGWAIFALFSFFCISYGKENRETFCHEVACKVISSKIGGNLEVVRFTTNLMPDRSNPIFTAYFPLKSNTITAMTVVSWGQDDPFHSGLDNVRFANFVSKTFGIVDLVKSEPFFFVPDFIVSKRVIPSNKLKGDIEIRYSSFYVPVRVSNKFILSFRVLK